jgi:transposase
LRAPTTEQRQVFRARIVLLAAEGRSTRSIARELDTMPRTVSGWRGRFAREGLGGLEDRPHPSPAPKYDSATGRRILALLDEPPPQGYARGIGPLLAEALGDVHEQQVWHFLRAQKIGSSGAQILVREQRSRVLCQTSFTSVTQLRGHIDAFIEAYNDNAKPFVWTKARVHQRRVKDRRISEL